METSDWQLDYLRLLRKLLDTEREAAERLWQRTRWVRWLTLPAFPVWVGLRAFINHSEEVWQAMWVMKTNPAQATDRERMLAHLGMPRLRWMAYAQLLWMRAILKEVIWVSLAISLCFYLIIGLAVVGLLSR
jgi:hypothetical protein